MIYTAIFQGAQGQLTHSRYLGVVNKHEAWLSAAKLGSSSNMCLIALVPGDHPIYFYENFVEDLSDPADRTSMKSHDVYEMS